MVDARVGVEPRQRAALRELALQPCGGQGELGAAHAQGALCGALRPLRERAVRSRQPRQRQQRRGVGAARAAELLEAVVGQRDAVARGDQLRVERVGGGLRVSHVDDGAAAGGEARMRRGQLLRDRVALVLQRAQRIGGGETIEIRPGDVDHQLLVGAQQRDVGLLRGVLGQAHRDVRTGAVQRLRRGQADVALFIAPVGRHREALQQRVVAVRLTARADRGRRVELRQQRGARRRRLRQRRAIAGLRGAQCRVVALRAREHLQQVVGARGRRQQQRDRGGGGESAQRRRRVRHAGALRSGGKHPPC
ncbi:hypothetical protein GALL_492490 [mine drainage metagenome]|uniref:Uncharacterized protein n=1 Tax=mine drainage metagenome TaxID=410659 RepID=A0A1J5PBX3_9ZZZZ